jgi:hypothetical protein
MGNIRQVEPALEIRQAVQEKGSRYGAMTRPYMVVVADCKGELTGGDKDARGARTIVITPKSGQGDVVAQTSGRIIAAECKGGIINTRHAGQVSRLYKGLCETVGLLMASPSPGRQVAVVPYTPATLRLAKRMAPRSALVGIEIALVKGRGEVVDVKPEPTEAPPS